MNRPRANHVLLKVCVVMTLTVLCLVSYLAYTRCQLQLQWQALKQHQQQLQAQHAALRQQQQTQAFVERHAIAAKTQPWLTQQRLQRMRTWQQAAQLPVLHYASVADNSLPAAMKAMPESDRTSGLQVEYWQIVVTATREEEGLRWLAWLQKDGNDSLMLRECEWSPTSQAEVDMRCVMAWWYVANQA